MVILIRPKPMGIKENTTRQLTSHTPKQQFPKGNQHPTPPHPKKENTLSQAQTDHFSQGSWSWCASGPVSPPQEASPQATTRPSLLNATKARAEAWILVTSIRSAWAMGEATGEATGGAMGLGWENVWEFCWKNWGNMFRVQGSRACASKSKAKSVDSEGGHCNGKDSMVPYPQ